MKVTGVKKWSKLDAYSISNMDYGSMDANVRRAADGGERLGAARGGEERLSFSPLRTRFPLKPLAQA